MHKSHNRSTQYPGPVQWNAALSRLDQSGKLLDPIKLANRCFSSTFYHSPEEDFLVQFPPHPVNQNKGNIILTTQARTISEETSESPAEFPECAANSNMDAEITAYAVVPSKAAFLSTILRRFHVQCNPIQSFVVNTNSRFTTVN